MDSSTSLFGQVIQGCLVLLFVIIIINIISVSFCSLAIYICVHTVCEVLLFRMFVLRHGHVFVIGAFHELQMLIKKRGKSVLIWSYLRSFVQKEIIF